MRPLYLDCQLRKSRSRAPRGHQNTGTIINYAASTRPGMLTFVTSKCHVLTKVKLTGFEREREREREEEKMMNKGRMNADWSKTLNFVLPLNNYQF